MIKSTGIRPHQRPKRARQKGIGLIEIALVLAIMSILLMGLWPMVNQLKLRYVHFEQQRTLNLAQDHLLFYLRKQGHLPCPSLTPQAHEARHTDGRCQQQLGYLPAQQLGLPNTLYLWYAVPASTLSHDKLNQQLSSASFWQNTPCYDQANQQCFTIQTPQNTHDPDETYDILVDQTTISQGQLIWLGLGIETRCPQGEWSERQACLIHQNQVQLDKGHELAWRSIQAMQLLQASGQLILSNVR